MSYSCGIQYNSIFTGTCNSVSYSTIIGGNCNTISGVYTNISGGYCTSTNYYNNKNYLAEIFMKRLGITEEDLQRDQSWIKAKIRDHNIDSILG